MLLYKFPGGGGGGHDGGGGGGGHVGGGSPPGGGGGGGGRDPFIVGGGGGGPGTEVEKGWVPFKISKSSSEIKSVKSKSFNLSGRD